MKGGKLFIVPTPVGNLKDITLRAIEVLRDCDLILSEDTRHSGQLLKHLEISKPLQSFHAHNEHEKLDFITGKLKSGLQIAMISDAGTPGISDPGFLLVRACIAEGIQVECLPGPTAFVPALVISGLPCDRFVFEGFMPVKKGRKTRFEQLASENRSMVFYESPFKLIRFLEDAESYFGGTRKAALVREISKMFEEVVRGDISELLSHARTKTPKGEMVIIIAGNHA